MRRRDVILADAMICLAVLVILPLLSVHYGAFAFVLIPIVVIARYALQRLVYDEREELMPRTFRRTVMNVDTISFDLFYGSFVAATAIIIWNSSPFLAMIMIIAAVSIRLASEYFFFSDRPNRWYSFRFKVYEMRRKFRPTHAERLQNVLISEVDGMKGHDFERYVAELLTLSGFGKVKVTKGSGDFGVDVTAVHGNDKYAVQCKRSESKIGIKAVQEAFLGKEHYKADVAVVVTNNYFTKQAYEAADGKVALWDRERLGNLIVKARDSMSDEKYNEQMASTDAEVKMFVALFDAGKGDARLTEKVMGTIYPAGNVRSEEDIEHFLKRVTEHIYEREGIPERRLERIRHALERDGPITPYEADMASYHLNGSHTITIQEMKDVRRVLAKAFIDREA